jgi:hypothetical protein
MNEIWNYFILKSMKLQHFLNLLSSIELRPRQTDLAFITPIWDEMEERTGSKNLFIAG